MVKCYIKFIWLLYMAQTMMWLSNSVLCNTLGTAVILRVHGARSRFLSSPLQSAHTVPVSPTSRQHPQQQQRNDPLCFTERRTSFREGPPPHNQASLFIYGGLEFLTSPPSAFGGGRGESGHRWRRAACLQVQDRWFGGIRKNTRFDEMCLPFCTYEVWS